MMDRLREKLLDLERASGHRPRAVLLQADMQALPFGDGQFDAVIAAHVFHLVADPERAWQEAWRVLRPEGVLLVCGDASTASEPVTIGETWRAIVHEEFGAIPNSSEVASRLIHEHAARDTRMHVDELRPVQWDFTVTPEEELDTVRRRLWSNTWSLPDDVFARCFARLEAWAAAHYAGRMDVPVIWHGEFVIRRMRRR
jgi:SAM-dependent methyltransferase